MSESKTEEDSFFSSHIPQIIKSLNANIVLSLYNVNQVQALLLMVGGVDANSCI